MNPMIAIAAVSLVQQVPMAPGTYKFETHARNATGPVCTETWELRADGTMTLRSGQEVLEKRYRFEHDQMGDRIVVTILKTNSKPDCMGNVTKKPRKHDRSIYLIAFNDGHVEVCPPPAPAPDGIPYHSGCYATLRPVKP